MSALAFDPTPSARIEQAAPRLQLCPVKLTEARAFVATHHSHNGPPQGWLFGTGVELAGVLVGVVIAGRPVSLKLQQADRYLVEITRCCTDSTRLACSKLYGAIWRMAVAGGYRRAITYTLLSEDAVALKATGWTCDGVMAYRDGWDSPTRPRANADLFGNRVQPDEPKVRWSKTVGRKS